MEVAVPMADFHFDSASNSPYATAPSSPRPFGRAFGYYTSAPSSPTRIATIYDHFNHYNHPTTTGGRPSLPSSTHFDWEEKRELQSSDDDESVDFAFEFGGQKDSGLAPITAADELFEEGKIRPLKPPPARILRVPSKNRSEKTPAPLPGSSKSKEATRGREWTKPSDGSRGNRRTARSMSPLRAGFDSGKSGGPATPPKTAGTATTTHSSKKWRLRDLLLFRSASEGRATEGSKDPLRKYTILSPLSSSLLSKKDREDFNNTSFRSMDSAGSSTTTTSSAARKGASAHENHYAAKRAASQEMKRKTFLPYRPGLLGCIRYNPAINGIAQGFKSMAHRRH